MLVVTEAALFYLLIFLQDIRFGRAPFERVEVTEPGFEARSYGENNDTLFPPYLALISAFAHRLGFFSTKFPTALCRGVRERDDRSLS